MRVFILQSIKPRVETIRRNTSNTRAKPSLSYNPSNQGLKHGQCHRFWRCVSVFILQSIKPRVETSLPCIGTKAKLRVFILQSIKPRVETRDHGSSCIRQSCLYPTIHQTKGWNQKPLANLQGSPNTVFILQSIKPRVETEKSVK